MISHAASILLLTAAMADEHPQPAAKQVAPANPWKIGNDRAALPNAKLSLPKKAATLSLTFTSEFSHEGEGIDNIAKYESPDGAVLATAYVYLPAFPDAALTAYETDKVLKKRFGSNMISLEQSVIDAPGNPSTVIRMTYDGGATTNLNQGEPIATASGFLRVGGWIVKLRVSGPTARRDEVFAGLDAMIAGLRLDQGAQVFPVALLQVAAPCPAGDRPAALIPVAEQSGAAVLEAAIMSVSANLEDASGRAGKIAPPFPSNGRDAVCVRGSIRIGNQDVPIFQPVGVANPKIALGILGDSGSMFVIQKTEAGGGYVLRTAKIGEASIFGAYDSIPTGPQLEALFGGKTKEGSKRMGRVKLSAKGDSKIDLVPGLAK